MRSVTWQGQGLTPADLASVGHTLACGSCFVSVVMVVFCTIHTALTAVAESYKWNGYDDDK